MKLLLLWLCVPVLAFSEGVSSSTFHPSVRRTVRRCSIRRPQRSQSEPVAARDSFAFGRGHDVGSVDRRPLVSLEELRF